MAVVPAQVHHRATLVNQFFERTAFPRQFDVDRFLCFARVVRREHGLLPDRGEVFRDERRRARRDLVESFLRNVERHGDKLTSKGQSTKRGYSSAWDRRRLACKLRPGRYRVLQARRLRSQVGYTQVRRPTRATIRRKCHSRTTQHPKAPRAIANALPAARRRTISACANVCTCRRSASARISAT